MRLARGRRVRQRHATRPVWRDAPIATFSPARERPTRMRPVDRRRHARSPAESVTAVRDPTTATPSPEADRSAHLSVAHPAAVAIGLFVVYVGVVVVVGGSTEPGMTRSSRPARRLSRGIVVPIGVVPLSPRGRHDVAGLVARGAVRGLTLGTRMGAGRPRHVRRRGSDRRTADRLQVAQGACLAVARDRRPDRRLRRRDRNARAADRRPAGRRWSAAAVFFLSTGLFALLHGVNALFGQSARLTLVQVGVSFLARAALYVTRMTTGTLLVCIVLHRRSGTSRRAGPC